jgi:hypothetical protein
VEFRFKKYMKVKGGDHKRGKEGVQKGIRQNSRGVITVHCIYE